MTRSYLAQEESFNMVLLLAPIVGLLGIVIGWWLNWTAEERRRRWEAADRERNSDRERAAEQQRWVRGQRVQAYTTMLTTAHGLDDRVGVRITTGRMKNQRDEDEALRQLLERLRREIQVLKLFAGMEVRKTADDVLGSGIFLVSAATGTTEWKRVDDYFPSYRRALREFAKAVRNELETGGGD